MDGFDDLLAPSRSALESNPFEDPFSKRSGSPDPWASGFQQQGFGDHDAFGGGFGVGESSTSPTAAADPFSLGVPADPLDSVAATRDDDAFHGEHHEVESPKDAAAPSSPGFRESVSATIDEVIGNLGEALEFVDYRVDDEDDALDGRAETVVSANLDTNMDRQGEGAEGMVQEQSNPSP